METNRHGFEIIKVGEPRYVGNPSLKDVPDLPSLISRIGTGSTVLARHLGAGISMVGAAGLLALYAVFLTLKGVINTVASLLSGEDFTISYDQLKEINDNFIAFLKENF